MSDIASQPETAADRIRRLTLEQDRPVFGAWMVAPTPFSISLFAAGGLDYTGIDCQHGRASEAAVADLLQTPSSGGHGRLVRVSANRAELIGRVLDGGADGIIIPTVNSAGEAAAAVAAVRFPPHGDRSYGPTAAYLPRDPTALSDRVLVLAMIETRAGLDAVAEIAAVDGIDGLYVGPADLGLALGDGHQQFPASERLAPALEQVIRAAREQHIIPAIHAGAEQFAPTYVDLGFRLLTLGTESSFVQTGITTVLRTLDQHDAAGAPPSSSPY